MKTRKWVKRVDGVKQRYHYGSDMNGRSEESKLDYLAFNDSPTITEEGEIITEKKKVETIQVDRDLYKLALETLENPEKNIEEMNKEASKIAEERIARLEAMPEPRKPTEAEKQKIENLRHQATIYLRFGGKQQYDRFNEMSHYRFGKEYVDLKGSEMKEIQSVLSGNLWLDVPKLKELDIIALEKFNKKYLDLPRYQKVTVTTLRNRVTKEISSPSFGSLPGGEADFYDSLWEDKKGTFFRGTAGGKGVGFGYLGSGTYVTWDKGMAEAFSKMSSSQHGGKSVVKGYKLPKDIKLMDWQSNEMWEIRKKMGAHDRWERIADPVFANILTYEVKKRGFDGVISSDVADGILIFDSSKLEEV